MFRQLRRTQPRLSIAHPNLQHYTAAMAANDWSSSLYLKFESERTRPSRDLLSQVFLPSNPSRIVDLGCGPGNSTAVLLAKYPGSHVTGMDASPDMIDKARKSLPGVEFVVQDISSYPPREPVDLFFANAVFQWLPRETRLEVIKNLIRKQPPGGVFAFQVPDNLLEPSHVAMQQTAESGPWASTLRSSGRDSFQSPQELYNELKPLCSDVNIWHTHYYHPLKGHEAVVEWVKGTGLRPFLTPLSATDQTAFLKDYLRRLETLYPKSADGEVLLRYPRLFAVAVRGG